MASEIKVDTVSEKTSGSGVTIDGLLIKDGGISGDVSLIGTTPTFTIGDAGAEDAALVFDGNAQDFYIALDDSADDLVIGKGSTVGTTPAVSIDENLQVIVHDNLSLLSDSSVLKFGTDGDTTLTHTDGTGLTLNSANKLTFRDSGLYVGSNADGDLDIVSDGTAVDSINIESAGGITLDAGTAGSGIIYEDDGTEMARIHNSSSDVIIESKVSDKDIIIKGNDGGSTATALTFDMSNKGTMVLGAHGGITFPGTQNASDDANTLDDYEEGTWTATITVDGGTMTLDSSNNTGSYVKIGRLVHVQGFFAVDSDSASAGYVGLSGLPFASDNLSEGQEYSAGSLLVRNASSAVAGGTVAWLEGAGQTMAHLRESGTTSHGGTLTGHFDDDTDFTVGITYRAGA
jgi:hypothetical protein